MILRDIVTLDVLRRLVFTCMPVCLGYGLAAETNKAASAPRPNILRMVADDNVNTKYLHRKGGVPDGRYQPEPHHSQRRGLHTLSSSLPDRPRFRQRQQHADRRGGTARRCAISKRSNRVDDNLRVDRGLCRKAQTLFPARAPVEMVAAILVAAG